MPTLEERVTRLEKRMDDEARLRALMDRDMADIGEKLRVMLELIQALANTQSDHTAANGKIIGLLDRHTTMLKENGSAISGLVLSERLAKGRDERIIGMLHTLIDRESGQ